MRPLGGDEVMKTEPSWMELGPYKSEEGGVVDLAQWQNACLGCISPWVQHSEVLNK